jgi:hypothetical protein
MIKDSPRPLYTGEETLYPLYMRLGGPERTGSGECNNYCTYRWGSNPDSCSSLYSTTLSLPPQNGRKQTCNQVLRYKCLERRQISPRRNNSTISPLQLQGHCHRSAPWTGTPAYSLCAISPVQLQGHCHRSAPWTGTPAYSLSAISTQHTHTVGFSTTNRNKVLR